MVDVFDTLTGLKIEPAAPVPSSATTFSWLAVQGAVVAGWVEVVVVEEVLVVEVVGASVVEVDVVAGVAVVVTGVAAWEQPATRTAKPRTIRERLATADLERRMSLLAMGTAPRAQAREEPSEPTPTPKYDDKPDAVPGQLPCRPLRRAPSAAS